MCLSTVEPTIIPPSNFSNDMRWTLNNKFLSDVTFEVEGKVFLSHRVLVCHRCPYFKRYGKNNKNKKGKNDKKY